MTHLVSSAMMPAKHVQAVAYAAKDKKRPPCPSRKAPHVDARGHNVVRRLFTVEGAEYTVKEIAEKIGLIPKSALHRLENGECTWAELTAPGKAHGAPAMLYPIEGEMLTIAQIAQRLGKKEATVRSRLDHGQRTWERLREDRSGNRWRNIGIRNNRNGGIIAAEKKAYFAARKAAHGKV